MVKVTRKINQGATLRQATRLNISKKVFGNILSLPNLHILRHLPEIAINFGTLINTNKRVILHTNKKDISMDLSRRDNTLQTVRYLLDGGLDSRYNEVNNLFTNIAYDTKISSNHSNFQNIQVRGLWKSSKIQNQGLSATLSAENLLTEFTRVYKELYNNNGIIIQRHINYYDSIQFIVRSKTDSYTNIILRVGEAIDVEDIDSLGERSYALIRAIITHKDDYGRINPFLLVNWFYKNGNVDPATGLPIYCLQESDDNLWFHLHPLIIVDQQPR
ncbi:20358_t:CDS:2, partial [Rhizophagus irregularis]